MPQFEMLKGSSGIAVSQKSKSLSLSSSKDQGELKLTNQYGNSVSFNLDDRGFEDLWSALWEFVKDRQH